jgi:hypothetical protein
VIALSLALGILALIGLLAVAKALFCGSSIDANFSESAAGRHDVEGSASARRCVTTR